MKEDYKPGDKVKSNLMGYYYGAKGIILKPAEIQDNPYKKYVIEPETGQKISLPINCILPTT